MAGLFFQPEGLFKVTFDIFSTRDGRRKQVPGPDCHQNVTFTANLSWPLSKRMSVHLYTSSHFSPTAYRTYISHLGQGDIAVSVRACLDLLPGLTAAVRNFDCLSRLFDGQFIEVGGSVR